ncbi:hypothetical protein MXD81_50795 [Microbacteriaceae bacterium K1510]|nr:hypothetical protein [Microbacteriaceae bacterium K1510]
MSKRPDAAAVAAAIKSNFASMPDVHDRRARGRDDLDGWTRSTFKAPRDAIIALRTVALSNGCTMNDLVLIAINDLLAAMGNPCPIAVKAALRDRIMDRLANKGAINGSP